MDMSDLMILTVTAYGETEDTNSQATLAPHMVKMILAFDDARQGRPVKRVEILFVDGDTGVLFVSEMDLLTIQQAIGAYGFA